MKRLLLAAAVAMSLTMAGNVQSGEMQVKLVTKFVKKKVYDKNFDLYIYEVSEADGQTRNVRVFVSTGFITNTIRVGTQVNNHRNQYSYAFFNRSNNFFDNNQLQLYSVNSLQDAAKLAVDLYLASKIRKIEIE